MPILILDFVQDTFLIFDAVYNNHSKLQTPPNCWWFEFQVWPVVSAKDQKL